MNRLNAQNKMIQGRQQLLFFAAFTSLFILFGLLTYNMYEIGPKNSLTETPENEIVSIEHNPNAIYIIPGGGGGADDDGYPEWTRQRIVAAHKNWLSESKNAVFLVLSAGSLNSPNTHLSDGRIVFECQHMIKHLLSLGVDKDKVYGDFMSWDTVTNGLTLRLFLEGLFAVRNPSLATNSQNEVQLANVLNLNVFISDFHVERVRATFEWVIQLKPSLSDKVKLIINSVSSQGVTWSDKEAFERRVEHEKSGVAMIKENSKIVTTAAELYAFIMLGPHKGLDNYLMGSYVPSKGSGW